MGKENSGLFSIVFLLLLFLPFVSSVGFEMKSEFNQGETLLAKISGYFLEPIFEENIFFYRGHIRIPIEHEIAKIDDYYYLYADLSGKTPSNYSVIIRDVRHMEFNEVTEEDIIKNFSINKDRADFSLEQGFIVTKDDFTVGVRNLKDEEITIKIKINTEEAIEEQEGGGFFSSLFGDKDEEETGEITRDSITLSAGKTEEILFLLESFEQGLNTIELSSENSDYEIPVYVSLSQEEIEIEKKERNLEFEPSELNISLSTESDTIRILYLFNTGEEDLDNISISLSNSLEPYINISVTDISELENGSSVSITLSVPPREDEVFVQGYIRARTVDVVAYSEIFLSFVEGYVPVNETQTSDIITTIKTCSEINGEICDADEECDGDVIEAKDGLCCLANCKEKGKSQIGRVIGITLLVIIIGALIFFYIRKSKKNKKKPIDLLKIARGKK